eukprot:14427260-Alexandrium_andersonii.AAC.1
MAHGAGMLHLAGSLQREHGGTVRKPGSTPAGSGTARSRAPRPRTSSGAAPRRRGSPRGDTSGTSS